jgi:hypothetical protein
MEPCWAVYGYNGGVETQNVAADLHVFSRGAGSGSALKLDPYPHAGEKLDPDPY